jgi:TPR repeat protein
MLAPLAEGAAKPPTGDSNPAIPSSAAINRRSGYFSPNPNSSSSGRIAQLPSGRRAYFDMTNDLVLEGRLGRGAAERDPDGPVRLLFLTHPGCEGSMPPGRNRDGKIVVMRLIACAAVAVAMSWSSALAAEPDDSNAPRGCEWRANDALFCRNADGGWTRSEIPDFTPRTMAEARAGDPKAMGVLGGFYTVGPAAQQDFAASLVLLRKAAEKGDSAAMYGLGYLYGGGLGVPYDPVESMRWHRAAAERGVSASMLYLGRGYRLGIGVPADPVEQARWLKAAAEHGQPIGMYMTGENYEAGAGVAKDLSEALRWYRASADAGDGDAMLKLGQFYSEGMGVTVDPVQMAYWFRMAAERGQRMAMFNLGHSYETGRGVAASREEAIRWYRASAAAGFEPASDKLKELGVSLQ